MAEMSSVPDSVPNLVVVGSSAGGIDALAALLTGLPSDFSAPIVIAQHLDPSRTSHLDSILSRRSPLPVRTVTDHAPLAASTVYVVPANRHVSITDTHIELSEDHNSRPTPSIDLLFSSAAEAFGERLIAVILSGMGTDGAAGARIVKRAGGTVIVQDPATATYPGMPLALAPSTVDIVASVERIGGILHDLLTGATMPEQPDERRQLTSFLDGIRDRFGLDFNSYKAPTIMRRLRRRIVATDSDDLAGYIEYLRGHPDEYQHLVNAFLIKVTEFFRDPDLFEYLRKTVVPDLVTQSRSRGNELRIWSAGCATGEEAYSLAIVVAEVLGAALEHFNVRIFATDADAEAIAFARRGVYPASALAHLPQDLISKYFTHEDGSYQVKKRVRALTIFGQHDLGGRAPFPNIDLIFCRNVLIYFTPDLQQRTLKLFAYSLRSSGYLVLGKAETPGALSEYYAPVQKLHKVYRRQGDRILSPPWRTGEIAPAPPHATVTRNQPNVTTSIRNHQHDVHRGRAAADTLLLRLPVGVVVVDRRYDIQMVNSAARRLLSIHGQAIGEDLIHIEQGVPQIRLREAIDSVFRTGAPAIVDEVAVEALTAEEPRYLNITCQPQISEGEQRPPETVIVVVQDVTDQVRKRKEVERKLQDADTALAQLRTESEGHSTAREQMTQRLVDTNRQLIEANQELTGTNEELRTMNEELLLNTEEAQAAIEEVETLNEELQATNEELETLNEELQATIEELNTTNDDLNARTGELQDLAQTSEQERARLEVILRSLSDAVIVVNSDGAPVLTNAAYERALSANGHAFVVEYESGQPLRTEDLPLSRAARGESFNMEFTVAQPDGSRRWYDAVGAPIAGDGRTHGGVVVIRDVTERSLHRLQDEFTMMASHELRTPLTTLQSSLQMLERQLDKLPADAQASRLTEMALRQVTRLARLVADLLDVRRLQSGKFGLRKEPFRVDEVVAQAVEAAELQAETKPIRVRMEDTPFTVNGDGGRIEQVILNLLTNAVTHAPDGKEIEVRVRRVDSDVEVEVQDAGDGIPAADLPHVFTRFYQVEHGTANGQDGLGLGLYISKEIVEAHGGSIGVTSGVGQGTTFTVRLPLMS